MSEICGPWDKLKKGQRKAHNDVLALFDCRDLYDYMNLLAKEGRGILKRLEGRDE